MRKLVLVLVLFMVFSMAAFANPICGKWMARVSNAPGQIALVVIDEGTAMDERVVIVAEICWLYYVIDVNHVALLGWVKGTDGMVPVLVEMTRMQPEDRDG